MTIRDRVATREIIRHVLDLTSVNGDPAPTEAIVRLLVPRGPQPHAATDAFREHRFDLLFQPRPPHRSSRPLMAPFRASTVLHDVTAAQRRPWENLQVASSISQPATRKRISWDEPLRAECRAGAVAPNFRGCRAGGPRAISGETGGNDDASARLRCRGDSTPGE